MKVTFSRNLYIILTIDIILLWLSFYGAHLIRFDFKIPGNFVENLWILTPWVVGSKLACFFFFDLYRGMWRYTDLKDLFNVAKAVSISTMATLILILYVNRFEGVSRSVFVIDWCFSIFFVGMLRIATRVGFEQFSEEVAFRDVFHAVAGVFKKKSDDHALILIIGAGNCGEKICKEIREDGDLRYKVAGFLDDDPRKLGRKIHGASVLDTIDKVGPIARSKEIDEIIIAIPTLRSAKMRKVIAWCKEAQVSFKTVPSMGELINGKVSINTVRPVEYRDLLGRKPVELDKERIGNYLGGGCVMVSGAGGSIGRGLCRQVCLYEPAAVLLVERAESPLYEIDLELKKEFPHIRIVPLLADIRDRQEMEGIFETFRPDTIFHAAAYKHVPMLENYPWKAVDNNIAGTGNMVHLAQNFNCGRFVFVSTDKAVNPVNVMGASKRIAEMIVQNQDKLGSSATRFMTVRFGNVIGSVGSVIPLFKKQIKEGGPVTVTHKDMERFFMLIPEACQLILQAGAMGRGEIFILEMGNPVRIDDMARDLIKFSGFVPDQDIKIEYTGLRPGEKLFEELRTSEEDVIPTEHNKIMVLNGKTTDLNAVSDEIRELESICETHDVGRIRAQLRKIIPEYVPMNENPN